MSPSACCAAVRTSLCRAHNVLEILLHSTLQRIQSFIGQSVNPVLWQRRPQGWAASGRTRARRCLISIVFLEGFSLKLRPRYIDAGPRAGPLPAGPEHAGAQLLPGWQLHQAGTTLTLSMSW